MARQSSCRQKRSGNAHQVSVRELKKELKLIPSDIKREMRFLDLLLAEKNTAKTQAEREVLAEFIDTSKQRVKFHQNRLERYQECYNRLKSKKELDPGLLLPEEIEALRASPPAAEGPNRKDPLFEKEGLRTGTDG